MMDVHKTHTTRKISDFRMFLFSKKTMICVFVKNRSTHNGCFASLPGHEVSSSLPKAPAVGFLTSKKKTGERKGMERRNAKLGGGFKDFLFSPLFGEDFQFD